MSEFYKIDLNNCLNYQSIDFGVNSDKAEGYRKSEDLFVPDTLPKPGEQFEFEGIPFSFPSVNPLGYDCMLAEGQVFEIPKIKFTKIHIIGFSEVESTDGIYTLKTSAGEDINLDIFFFWFWKGTEHWSHERRDDTCKDVFLALGKSNSPRGIFYNTAEFPESEITKFILPFDPLVHIYSITLS